jgi:general stress protein YciG
MAGNRKGGLKTAQSVYAQYGPNYYRMIGYIGGKAKTDKPKGFAANPELARTAGAKGGSISRRGKTVTV